MSATRSRSSSLSSAPVSETHAETQTPEPHAAVNGHVQEDEDEETLFVTPTTRRSARIANATKKRPTKVITKLSGRKREEEKQRRTARYRFEYEAFLQDFNRRNQQRAYVDTRNRIWNQSTAKAQARIEEIEKEKRGLEKKIADMGVLQEKWNEENEVGVTRDEDLDVKKKYEDYFKLEADELEVKG